MAAGLGFKDFTTGEVLTATDVDGYLMQGIWVFADATARDAAVTSPQEGNFAFLKDTNVTTYYTGSTWANVDTTGMTNPMTTTGDVIYSSSGSTPARLGIGTANQVLRVNSGATAPEWATVSSGLTLIATQAISAVSSISAANDTFTSTYENYRVMLKITTFVGQDQTIRFRTSGTDDTAANYRYAWVGIDTGGTARSATGTAETSALFVRGNSAHDGIMSVTFDIFAPQLAQKTTATGQAWGSDGAPSSFTWSGGVAFNDTTVFDSFTLIFPGSTTGTMSIYGLAK